MPRFALLLACLAAAPPKPRPSDAGTPRADWHSNAGLRDDQATALCRAELRTCRHPYAVLVGPPNPCANMGIRCPDELMPKMSDFSWSCGCDPCMQDSECPDAGYCEYVSRCPPERSFTRCTSTRPARAGGLPKASLGPDPCPVAPPPP